MHATDESLLALFSIALAPADQMTTAEHEAASAYRAAAAAKHSESIARPLRPHCGRCGGSGYIPSFQHIKGGACFACN